MIDRSFTPVMVTAVRIGRTDLGEGSVILDDDSINVMVRSTVDDHPVRMGLESVDGIAVAGDELALVLRDGTRVTLVSAGAARFASDLLARCRALPELTRALRTFGSRRGTRGRRASAPVDQRRFFAPLLDARRLAGVATTPVDAIAAFDATALAQALGVALREFVTARHAEQGPARRAFEAELDEITEPLMLSIHSLEAAGDGARSAVDDLKLWRAWSGQLRSTFEVADRVWMSLDAALDAVPLHP